MADNNTATFSSQVSKWVNQTKRRTEGVFKASAQEVINIAQTPVGDGGNMPIDTGFLRASLRTGLNGNIPTGETTDGDAAEAKKGNVATILAIGFAKLGDTISGGWTAEYAAAVHNGISADEETGRKSRDGKLWLDLAAQQWPAIVARMSRKAEAKNT